MTDWGTEDQCPLCGAPLEHSSKDARLKTYWEAFATHLQAHVRCDLIRQAEAEATAAVRRRHGVVG